MAQILNKWSYADNPNVNYKVSASVVSRGVDTVKIAFKVSVCLRYSASWLGTGHELYVHVYAGGSWSKARVKSSSSVWRGTGTHSITITKTISIDPANGTLSGVKFKATNTKYKCGDLGSTSCSKVSVSKSTAHLQCDAAKLKVTGYSNNSITMQLSGLETASGYTRKIKWQLNKKTVSTVTANGTGTLTYTFKGLLPSSANKITALICSGDTTVRSLSVTQQTSNEEMKLEATAGATTVDIHVSKMQSSPAYKRVVRVYVKEGSNYVLSGTYATQNSEIDITIENLKMQTAYDFKVEVSDGTNVFVSDTVSATTMIDYSLVPNPIIRALFQHEGMLFLDFGMDRKIAGTVCEIKVVTNGDASSVQTSDGSMNPISFAIPDEGEMVVTIKISHPDVEEAKTVSKAIYVTKPFTWSDLTRIKASDWNRLILKIGLRLRNIGVTDYSEYSVQTGQVVSAEAYNYIASGLKRLNPEAVIPSVTSGDKIRISDLDLLEDVFNDL